MKRLTRLLRDEKKMFKWSISGKDKEAFAKEFGGAGLSRHKYMSTHALGLGKSQVRVGHMMGQVG